MTVGAIGCLAPRAPWTASLAWVASRAVALIHADGAAVAIIGDVRDMDARAILLDGGFADFRAAAIEASALGGAAASVRLDEAALTLSAGGVDPLAVPADGATRWDPRPGLAKAAASLAADWDRAALAALRVGVLAIQQAGGTVDAQAVRSDTIASQGHTGPAFGEAMRKARIAAIAAAMADAAAVRS